MRLLIEQLDKKGLSPLHHAAMRRDPHAVRWLLEAWPAAAEQVTGGAFSHMPGCLALHLLVRGPGTEPKRLRLPVSSEDATVACRLLLAAAPHTITARVPSPGQGDEEVGRLPLHLAASFGAPPPHLTLALTRNRNRNRNRNLTLTLTRRAASPTRSAAHCPPRVGGRQVS